ncbi:MAG TPA: FGGY-family carbohydrate kinase [Candidatus Atribacteria bacterium]|nr:FGGY-family carbohydrate kinase [Candidatus Atribacteria bacterium]
MSIDVLKQAIEAGKTALGIELGSTRIKAVLTDLDHNILATGSHRWENRFENGVWTYSLDDIWNGLRSCYADLCRDVSDKYGTVLTTVGSMGISAMMHGYMAFGKNGNLLVPFRTWRNTITGEAAEKLTDLFKFNIPQRWSIAHLYQAMLNGEDHVGDIDYLTTLAGYIHWKLTGERTVGIGEASGMFPIENGRYAPEMLEKFDCIAKDMPWRLVDILPRIQMAGEQAGVLTEEGARLLDPSGNLRPGAPLCPPEGDAGTGMVATNAIVPRTGNISAGTSVFAMIVLEKPLSRVYVEIDIVTTPVGDPVAMVHCNNCTSEIDAWVDLMGEAASALGAKFDADKLYATLFNAALKGDADCDGMLSYNYFAGEPVTGFDEGRPLFVRKPGSRLTLANFMRSQLYGAIATLKLGMDILSGEQVAIDSITGHGGYFKTSGVGQRMMAAALNTPVTVMETAGEGGPWGMAILAAYMKNRQDNETLSDYLNNQVFKNTKKVVVEPDEADVAGFESYIKDYSEGLKIQRAAVEALV